MGEINEPLQTSPAITILDLVALLEILVGAFFTNVLFSLLPYTPSRGVFTSIWSSVEQTNFPSPCSEVRCSKILLSWRTPIVFLYRSIVAFLLSLQIDRPWQSLLQCNGNTWCLARTSYRWINDLLLEIFGPSVVILHSPGSSS